MYLTGSLQSGGQEIGSSQQCVMKSTCRGVGEDRRGQERNEKEPSCVSPMTPDHREASHVRFFPPKGAVQISCRLHRDQTMCDSQGSRTISGSGNCSVVCIPWAVSDTVMLITHFWPGIRFPASAELRYYFIVCDVGSRLKSWSPFVWGD